MAMSPITGLKPLQRKLDQLKRKSRVRVERAAVIAGLNEVAKHIKKGVSSRIKQVRKTVKSRFYRGTKRTVAKVGFGVGPRNKKQVASTDRPKGRGGVGISGNNVHWWILGTKRRATKAGNSTGRMPAMQRRLVPRAYSEAKAAMFRKMIAAGRKRLAKEVKSLKNFR